MTSYTTLLLFYNLLFSFNVKIIFADPLKVGEEKETTDKEITDKVKETFDQDLDAPDLTEEKKATVIKCARGLAKGGKEGELKEKDEKGVDLGISITTEVETEETKIT